MTDGSTIPLGQIRLPITFGKREDYRIELIDFDVAQIRLPYNAILRYPALAKFMALTHHAYNVPKMPGSCGIITVACDEKDAVCSLERAYQAAAVKNSDDEGTIRPPETVPKKKKQLLLRGPQEAGVSDDRTLGPAPTAGAPFPLA